MTTTKTWTKLLGALALLTMTACGAGRSPAPKAQRSPVMGGPAAAQGTEEAPARDGGWGPAPEAEAGPGEDADAAGEARAEGSPTSRPGRAQGSGAYRPRRKTSRPGLGTKWGETRASRVSSAVFHRADPSSPMATATIHYNDRAGVLAMVDHERRHDHGDNLYEPVPGLTVRVLDAGHRPLPSFRAAGRNYVVGAHGQRYSIQIRNRTGHRVEAVTTVDGLDVLDGRPGSFSKRGYIVDPWATVEIDGFRRSYDAVAAFRFGSVSDSYAAKKGGGRNVGVIGVAFFHEAGTRYPWPDPAEVHRRHNADPFPGRFAPPPRY